jgi:hypothetical protein
MHFEKTKLFSSTLKNRCSLPQRRRCTCKFRGRSIGSWSQSYDRELQRQRCKIAQHTDLLAKVVFKDIFISLDISPQVLVCSL